MALIDPITLIEITDRAAWQYEQMLDVSLIINPDPTNTGYYQMVTLTEDPDQEVPMLQGMLAVDSDFDLVGMVRGTRLKNVPGIVQNHFIRVSEAGGMDGYLFTNDLRVSDFYNQVNKISLGQYLLAVNVFSETDDTFGTVEIIGGPSVDFTDGINYGTGNQFQEADGTDFAATQLKIVTTSVIGASDIELTLSVKDVNDNPTTIDVTVLSGSGVGVEVLVGTTSDRFLDVMGVSYKAATVDEGTVGDTFRISNVKERQITAAKGGVLINNYTLLSGDTVTVDGTPLVEGVDWAASTDNNTTSISLADAIDSNVASVSAVTAGNSSGVGSWIVITAVSLGAVGNTIAMTTDDNDSGLTLSGLTLSGGLG